MVRAVGLSVLVSSAVAVRKSHVSARSDSSILGYTEAEGKCTGNWIEFWQNGNFAHYGEDYHISDVDDCADVCDSHPECAGFYVKPNGKCSHWRSGGSISAEAASGHTCYMKEGGASVVPSAPMPRAHSATCPDVQGFTVQPGKCTGRWIEEWQDGKFAHYGEDYHINGVSDCASTCNTYNECSGFYTKEGKCSYWRAGSVGARPHAGHCCYTKSRSSLAQIEDQLDLEMEAEEIELANYTIGAEDEDGEDIDAETGLPGCCWRNCCGGRPNRRDRCWCNGSMCRARRHHGGFCWNRYHYHHRPYHGGHHGGGWNRGGGGGVHVHFR